MSATCVSIIGRAITIPVSKIAMETVFALFFVYVVFLGLHVFIYLSTEIAVI